MKSPDLSSHIITEKAIHSFDGAIGDRHRKLLQGIVKHLHAFVLDTRPTEEEWLTAIRFLTETGKTCDGAVRQEFILLSDVLGVSMLVDALNHDRSASATESTVFGPFYIEGMPDRGYGENMSTSQDVPLLLCGKITDDFGRPIADAVLDVWQAASNGMYSGQDKLQSLDNLRGKYHTNKVGNYAIQSILPPRYPIPDDGPVGRLLKVGGRHPWRPAHVHFKIAAEGHHELVTHLFNEEDEYLESDAVFGVKDSLKVSFRLTDVDHPRAREFGFNEPFYLAEFDFALEAS
ncbi:6-chlorohydroxyquinol-1,2-dioxygenase [Pseudomonas salomonii]|uniref:6-chlorohydroxyquinol-1,2-dioxygenase n=1 Tax=Pseudomonas salomonii TaxID=191391 RepID=A0A7Y8GHF5_9PSED|nr:MULTISPECIES: dioxygenase [Pseudomonas]NWF10889.1 6-chlorohydroxyquinol-1,2-dioxygenase [Pseudomonas salomonii]CRM54970.1 Hydroxyquinol 1,2-dioxygenase [Pseudomonas sp. 58 R 3]